MDFQDILYQKHNRVRGAACQPLRQPNRDWVAEFAREFYKTGEANEGKQAFLDRRESDFSRFPRS